MLFRLFKITI